MKNIVLLIVVLTLAVSCKNKAENSSPNADLEGAAIYDTIDESLPKISLAQWSLHRKYKAKNANPFNFAKDAKALGFDAVEFVTQLYVKKIAALGFEAVIDSLQYQNDKYGVRCNLIMVDNEGDLADPDIEKRNAAVENHKKWVDATARLGGHSIRVNTFGTNDPEVWVITVQDGLRKLSEYAATKNINVIAENHGWLSSNPPLVMKAINGVNLSNCGTLPDFGNWCVKRENEERWGKCVETYPDPYMGIKTLMPAAKGVSAKAYAFDADGNETTIDYYKMMQIVKDAGYTGYIGVEYENEQLDEEAGIAATKALIIKAYQQAN